MTLNSALEPKAGSPTIMTASFTGGLGSEKSAFTIYGYTRRLSQPTVARNIQKAYDEASGIALTS